MDNSPRLDGLAVAGKRDSHDREVRPRELGLSAISQAAEIASGVDAQGSRGRSRTRAARTVDAVNERIQRELRGEKQPCGRKPQLTGETLAAFEKAYWAWHDNTPQQLQRRFGVSNGTYARYVKIIRGKKGRP